MFPKHDNHCSVAAAGRWTFVVIHRLVSCRQHNYCVQALQIFGKVEEKTVVWLKYLPDLCYFSYVPNLSSIMYAT